MSADATLGVYEQEARRWRDRRGPDRDHEDGATDELRALADSRVDGPLADLGCGPGWHTAILGPGSVALDGARAMLDLVPEQAPGAPRVQADLRALPFARGSLGGAWASRSYVHLPATALPLALHDLHRCLAVGAPARLVLFEGDAEHTSFPEDDFAGRRFSLWPEPRLRAVLAGAGFSVTAWRERPTRGGRELRVAVRRERTLADTVAAGMRLLVVGLNPSVYSADAGHGFARPGNRFWPALVGSGLASRAHDPLHLLAHHRVGMTDLVKRATPRADELAPDEYRQGLTRLHELVSWLRPGAVCVVGLTGWRTAVDRSAVAGIQDTRLGGRPVYLMPNTSGLNAHQRVQDFVDHLRAAAALADAGAVDGAPPEGSDHAQGPG